MTIQGSTPTSIRIPALCFLGLLIYTGSFPIGTACASEIAGVLQEAPPDSLLNPLPSRTADVIQQELTAADAMEAAGKSDLASAQPLVGATKAEVDVRKSEIDALKAKLKLAKEQKHQTEQADLEQQIKSQQLVLTALETRKEMRDAEVSRAGAVRDAAQAQSGFLKKELDLLKKRGDLDQMSAAPGASKNIDALVRLQREVRDLEAACLQLQKDLAEKEKTVADSESNLVDKRIKLEQAQIAIVAGPKK